MIWFCVNDEMFLYVFDMIGESKRGCYLGGHVLASMIDRALGNIMYRVQCRSMLNGEKFKFSGKLRSILESRYMREILGVDVVLVLCCFNGRFI